MTTLKKESVQNSVILFFLYPLGIYPTMSKYHPSFSPDSSFFLYPSQSIISFLLQNILHISVAFLSLLEQLVWRYYHFISYFISIIIMNMKWFWWIMLDSDFQALYSNSKSLCLFLSKLYLLILFFRYE